VVIFNMIDRSSTGCNGFGLSRLWIAAIGVPDGGLTSQFTSSGFVTGASRRSPRRPPTHQRHAVCPFMGLQCPKPPDRGLSSNSHRRVCHVRIECGQHAATRGSFVCCQRLAIPIERFAPSRQALLRFAQIKLRAAGESESVRTGRKVAQDREGSFEGSESPFGMPGGNRSLAHQPRFPCQI